MAKVLKCAGNDDSITIRHENDSNGVTFAFESQGSERVAEFELKLMNIDTEHLGIPVNIFEATFVWSPQIMVRYSMPLILLDSI